VAFGSCAGGFGFAAAVFAALVCAAPIFFIAGGLVFRFAGLLAVLDVALTGAEADL
jgi:hypothetical protein